MIPDFNTLYLTLHQRIFRLAARIVGSREDAEDACQDLYERLWRRRFLIIAQRNPQGYILAAARNMCLDRLRARKPVAELPSTLAEEPQKVGDDTTEIVERLLAALPEKQRTAIHLRDVEGLEMDEIAKIMGSSATAVRMALSRGRATLREQMTKIMNYGCR